MTKTVAYHWHLRKIMNEHGMNATTDLVPLLAEQGVVMTSTQVYRIVTGEPERLNMRLLAALCDIFDVTPNDLIEPYVATRLAARTQDRHHRRRAAEAAQEPSDPCCDQVCRGLTGPDGKHDRPRHLFPLRTGEEPALEPRPGPGRMPSLPRPPLTDRDLHRLR